MNTIFDLSGNWLLLLDSEKKGRDLHYEALPSSAYSEQIFLPGSTSYAGIGAPNEETATGYLTDAHKFEGYAWYRREVTLPPAGANTHYILTLERTRISHVWVNEQYIGSHDTFIGKHEYDLTAAVSALKTPSFSLTVLVSNTDYKAPGGHMTSPDTQTNWNGILGEISIKAWQHAHISTLVTTGMYTEKAVRIALETSFDSDIMSTDCLVEASADLCILKEDYRKPDSDCSIWETIATTRQALPTDRTRLETYLDTTPQILLPQSYSLPSGKLSFLLPLTSPSGEVFYWDEETPYLYHITLRLLSRTHPGTVLDEVDTYFGLRKFAAADMHFTINDRPTFLRGRHQGLLFPLSGFAPMNVEGWLKDLKIAKNYGFNHERCHTCCPPEAAFLAADLLGIYFQPEVPFWGTWYVDGEDGFDPVMQEFLIQEGFEIINSFRNHPSFCMMSLGNELWGNAGSINEVMGRYLSVFPELMITQGSNNFQWVPNIQPNDTFFSGVRFTLDRQIRGSYATCDKPLGPVQTLPPGTGFTYDNAIKPPIASAAQNVSEDGTIEIQYGTGVKRVKLTEATKELIPQIPVVSHEIGQYETFPDFREISHYTGPLKPRNLEIFQTRLEKAGMLPLADDFVKASGALAVACYKSELEAALRSRYMAGFQVLDLQDFTGQGTALVGVLNSLMESKGLITPKEFRSFCSDAVLMAKFDSYVVAAGSDFSFSVCLAYYRRKDLSAPKLHVKLVSGFGEPDCLWEESLALPNTISAGLHALAEYTISLPEGNAPTTATLTLSIEGTEITNTYTLWLYPTVSTLQYSRDVLITHSKEDAFASVDNHHLPALLILSPEENPNSVPGYYASDFWCYPMFRSISESMGKEVAVGTMGLLIQNDHPALAAFPSEMYSTPQWYEIVSHSASTVLDDTDILPIVQTIDNFERNHKLGLLYEIPTPGGNTVLVCGADLPALMQSGCYEAAALLNSLLSYLAKPGMN